MKWLLRSIAVALCLSICIISGCSISPDGSDEPDPDDDSSLKTTPTDKMPVNIIQIGDSFDYTFPEFTGRLSGTVTDVRVVRDASDCPPRQWFGEIDTILASATDENGVWLHFPYEELFTDGGAYDHGCRLLLVDLTLTNVDAECPVDQGRFDDGGWYRDPYLFMAYSAVSACDLTVLTTASNGPEPGYYTFNTDGFSYMGTSEQDDPSTKGYEQCAIRIAPGESVSFTLCYIIPPQFLEDGTTGNARDLSKIWLCVGAVNDLDTGVFIDTQLGEDSP